MSKQSAEDKKKRDMEMKQAIKERDRNRTRCHGSNGFFDSKGNYCYGKDGD